MGDTPITASSLAVLSSATWVRFEKGVAVLVRVADQTSRPPDVGARFEDQKTVSSSSVTTGYPSVAIELISLTGVGAPKLPTVSSCSTRG